MFSLFLRRAPIVLRRYFRVITAVLLISLILMSCTSPAFPRIIKIGLVAPFEGAYRSTGYGAIYAARLAVREINAVSVAEGWAIELVAYDDRAEDEWAQASARNLVSDPDVLAVIGHYSRETTTTASDIYAEAKLPLLIMGTGPDAPTNWHLFPPAQQYVAEILDLTSALTSNPVIWGEGHLVSELSQQLDSQGQPTLLLNPDEIVNTPSIIFSSLPAIQTAEHLVEWSEQGWQGSLVGLSNLYASGFSQVSGKWKDRACFLTPYPSPIDIAGLDHWKKAYVNTGPHVPEPGPYALPTYEVVYTLADAIDLLHVEGKPLNRQQLNWALAFTQRTGKLGTISWNVDGYWINPTLYWYCWNDGLLLMQSVP